MSILPKPTTVEQDGAKVLRNQLGFREVLGYLRRCSEDTDNAAIHHSGTSVDVLRGRAQVLRALIGYLEAKSNS